MKCMAKYSVSLLLFTILFDLLAFVNCIDYQKHAPKKEQRESMPSIIIGSNRSIELSPDHSIEIKARIGGFAIECFYEFLKPGNIFHMVYQVVKGGDLKIQVTMINPEKKTILYEPSSQSYWYDNSDIKLEGAYKMCFKNKTAKKNSLLEYHNIFNTRTKKKAENDDLVEISNKIIMNYIQNIGMNLHNIRLKQTLTRMEENREYYLLEENNSYVFYFSVAQIFIAIISGTIQVFFIRKLFQFNSQKPKA